MPTMTATKAATESRTAPGSDARGRWELRRRGASPSRWCSLGLSRLAALARRRAHPAARRVRGLNSRRSRRFAGRFGEATNLVIVESRNARLRPAPCDRVAAVAYVYAKNVLVLASPRPDRGPVRHAARLGDDQVSARVLRGRRRHRPALAHGSRAVRWTACASRCRNGSRPGNRYPRGRFGPRNSDFGCTAWRPEPRPRGLCARHRPARRFFMPSASRQAVDGRDDVPVERAPRPTWPCPASGRG